MRDDILVVENLYKRFGGFTAVDGISFYVPKGKVVGLLGPNGAGKTTVIQMLLGILRANGGSISYLGKNFFEEREYCLSRINYASAFNTLQGRISVFENLLVFSGLYSIKNPEDKIKKLADRFEISGLLNKKYWDLSTGQRTRVNVVKSLLNDPKIILMDEPTASLDPDIADKFLSMIEEMRELFDLSILYTSHDMQEVERICDQVIFLNQGKIVAKGTPAALARNIAYSKVTVVFEGERDVVRDFLNHKKIKYKLVENTFVLRVKEQKLTEAVFALKSLKVKILDIEIAKASLENYFLSIARGGEYESS
jgi:ABC-2 type transport system ATP-binding protein